MNVIKTAEEIQAEQYETLSDNYDSAHADDEHNVALCMLSGMLKYLDAKSVLDVGAGTGRTLRALKNTNPDISAIGIEPVPGLRNAAYKTGIPETEIIDGNGYDIKFSNNSFDVVTAVGVLHHVRHPDQIIQEMLRTASKAIFISDANNFGGGSRVSRLAKQTLHQMGLWDTTQLILTKGKRYHITEGDGLFYSYSVFNSLRLIRSRCRSVHIMNTAPSGDNLYRSAKSIAILGII
jgi:2-polyprenyl-3-methyl-5-hydroxy-6-metoxy-1,4-benzoquinol methylase